MANPTAEAIVKRVRVLLHDPSAIRWEDDELIDWMNDGVQTILTFNPAALTQTVDIVLVAGVKQELPATVQRLMESFTNKDAAGNLTNAVTPVSRQLLSAEDPNWTQSTALKNVDHIIYDELNPTEFYVYPPQPAATDQLLNCECAMYPTLVDSMDDSISLTQEHQEPLVLYVASKALAKDGDDVANENLSNSYYAMFAELIGAEGTVRNATSPNVAERRKQYQTGQR